MPEHMNITGFTIWYLETSDDSHETFVCHKDNHCTGINRTQTATFNTSDVNDYTGNEIHYNIQIYSSFNLYSFYLY